MQGIVGISSDNAPKRRPKEQPVNGKQKEKFAGTAKGTTDLVPLNHQAKPPDAGLQRLPPLASGLPS